MQLFEKLIEYPEAERLVMESTPRLPVQETPLGEALGLALARDLTATTDSPPFDNSAVDGYAVRSLDAEVGRVFDVVDEAPAGRPAKKSVGEGEAIKIFTGGVIPDGVDAVVMVENTSGWGEKFDLKKIPAPGNNIRAAGEDTRRGDVILTAGTEVGAPEIALAATQGYGALPVYRRPKVVVLSTGTELVEPGTRDLAPGEIFDSNSYAIVAAAREAGAEARRLYAASDDADTLRVAIDEALETADVVVTSGGVSVGEKDLVKSTMLDLGVDQIFWGVKFKPGKPLFYGTRGETRLFGLPGNPVSAQVTFDVFVRAALLRMQGARVVLRPQVEVELLEPMTNRSGRKSHLPARVRAQDGRLVAARVPTAGSADVVAHAAANALVVMDAARLQAAAGEKAPALLLGNFLDRDGSA